jgi:hypothetical protein
MEKNKWATRIGWGILALMVAGLGYIIYSSNEDKTVSVDLGVITPDPLPPADPADPAFTGSGTTVSFWQHPLLWLETAKGLSGGPLPQ